MNQTDTKRIQAQLWQNAIYLLLVAYFGHKTGAYGLAFMAGIILLSFLFWSIIGGGLSECLVRMIKIRNSKGQLKNVANLRRNMILWQIFIGFLGSVGMFLGADLLCKYLLHIPIAAMGVRFFALFLLFHGICTALKGYLQAYNKEMTVLVLELVRGVMILILGSVFGKVFSEYGEKVSNLLIQEKFTSMYFCIGLALGIVITEAVMVLIFFVCYRKSVKKIKKKDYEEDEYYSERKKAESMSTQIGISYRFRGAGILIRILFTVPFFLGLNRFLPPVGDDLEKLSFVGNLVGGYLIPCGMLIFILCGLSLPIIPKIFGYMKRDEKRNSRNFFRYGVHICFIYTMFWTVLATLFASPIADLFAFEGAVATSYLQVGASVILLLTLWYFFTDIISRIGGGLLVVFSALAGVGVFGLFYMVIWKEKTDLKEFVLSLVIGCVVACFIAAVLTCRRFRAGTELLACLIVPVGVSCVVGLLCLAFRSLLMPHIGALVALITVIVICTIVYWVLLVVLRNLSEEELPCIFGGKFMKAVGEILKIY